MVSIQVYQIQVNQNKSDLTTLYTLGSPNALNKDIESIDTQQFITADNTLIHSNIHIFIA